MRRNINRSALRIPAASQRLKPRDKSYLLLDEDGGLLVLETPAENDGEHQTALLVD